MTDLERVERKLDQALSMLAMLLPSGSRQIQDKAEDIFSFFTPSSPNGIREGQGGVSCQKGKVSASRASARRGNCSDGGKMGSQDKNT